MGSREGLEAFRNYRFDSDENWKNYRFKLEFPAGANQDALLRKFKAKWYKQHIDPDFDVSLVTAGTGTSTPSSTSTGSKHVGGPSGHQSSCAGQQQQQQASQQRNTSPGGQGKPAGSQTMLFGAHMAMIVLCLVSVQPIFRRAAALSWTYYLQASTFAHAYQVFLRYGSPRLRPFPAALAQWMQPVAQDTDFQYALMSVMFLSSRPVVLLLVPLTVLAVYHAFAYGATYFNSHWLWQKYGACAYQVLLSKQRDAATYNATAEIGVGLLLIVMLVTPQRNILLLFLFWQFLRMRYFSASDSQYHQQVWRTLEQKARPVLDAAPILRKGIGFVQRWFLSSPHGQ